MRTVAHSQRALALPLVLWAVFVVSTVVVVTLRLVDFDLDLEARSAKRFVARQAALTGLAYAMHPKVERTDPELHQTLPDGSKIDVQIESEDARLNINTLLVNRDSLVLRNLFRYWGVDEKSIPLVLDSLKDWVDPDELRSLNGAEAADLENAEEYSLPENRPFLRVAEMESVRGMDVVSRVKPDWKNYFSVKSSNLLDLQDVSPDLLRAVGGLSEDQARAIVDFRNGADRLRGTKDDQVIKSTADVARIIPLQKAQADSIAQAFGAGGSLRRIVSRGSIGGVSHEIAVIVNAGGGGGGGQQPTYLEWLER